jgi:caa(3)-type oxidase subunit IV
MSSEHSTEHGHGEHGASLPILLGTFAFLIVMLIITVAAAYVHMPPFLAISVMLAIATAKAYAVIIHFMGVRWNTKLTWLWVGIGWIFLFLMFFIAVDHMTREWVGHGQPW